MRQISPAQNRWNSMVHTMIDNYSCTKYLPCQLLFALATKIFVDSNINMVMLLKISLNAFHTFPTRLLILLAFRMRSPPT
jgi:hypothetical protein